MTQQDQDKYVLRLPDGLRDRIKADAAANGRSMNAEILMRLGVDGDVESDGEEDLGRRRYPSGRLAQFMTRMPIELRNEVRDAAEANGRSMNSEIVGRVKAGGTSGLHDLFAAHAFGGLIAAQTNNAAIEDLAARALECADAMLKAREERDV